MKELPVISASREHKDRLFNFILKPFLMEHMAEVANMLSEELQELNAKQLIARANYKKGEKKGITNMSSLISWLFSQNRDEDVKKAASDPEYLDKLFAEYSDANKDD